MSLFPEAAGFKRCNKCGQVKPFSEFYARAAGKHGINAFCKTCQAACTKEARERRKANPIPRIIPESKRCTRCKQIKPAADFYRNARCADGLDCYCKDCSIAKVRIGHKKFKEQGPILPEDGMKVCARCKQSKPLSAFHTNRAYKDHHHAYCRECTMIIKKPRDLKKQYGLSMEQYEAMRESQKDLCAICGQPETATRLGEPVVLTVDHDHNAPAGFESVRELLCARCNLAIGAMETLQSLDLFDKAIAYLMKHHSCITCNPLS